MWIYKASNNIVYELKIAMWSWQIVVRFCLGLSIIKVVIHRLL